MSDERPVRRGFLKALGLGTAAAATPALAQRADQVPAGDARKENESQRNAARYNADSPQVQAFYRTNKYE
jgi:hypothetical protein